MCTCMKILVMRKAPVSLVVFCVLFCSQIFFASSLTEPLLQKTGKKESPAKAHGLIGKPSSKHASPAEKIARRVAAKNRFEFAAVSSQETTFSSWLSGLSLNFFETEPENVTAQADQSYEQQLQTQMLAVIAARTVVESETMDR